jgi:transcriptional regulator with XRE-family HTH domain
MPDGQSPSLGRRIRITRRSKRLTQRELARRAQLTEPFVSRVENDHAEPSIQTLGRIATAMGVTIGDLLGVEPSRFKPTCPVSESGRCVAELVYQPGPRTQLAAERYSPRQIRLLRLANHIVQHAPAETLAALETVIRGLVKLQTRKRDASARGYDGGAAGLGARHLSENAERPSPVDRTSPGERSNVPRADRPGHLQRSRVD